MNRLACVFVLTASGAVAQGLPVFDETQGFSVLGGIDDGLLVTNAGQAFYCTVDEGPEDSYFVLEACAPIIGPDAAAAQAVAAANSVDTQEALLGALENLPDIAFVPMVSATMRENACKIDFSQGEEDFAMAFGTHVAVTVGYTGELTQKVADKITELAEDAAEGMMKDGLIVVDRDTRIATLVDCP